MLSTGWATRDITPARPAMLQGQMHVRVARKARDPLTVTAMWTPAGDLALTVLADTGALRFLPDGDNLKAKLEVLIGDRTADGVTGANRSPLTPTVPAAQWEAARLRQTRYEGIWKPAADATGLRVIVLDVSSGQYGSLDVPLNKVPKNSPK